MLGTVPAKGIHEGEVGGAGLRRGRVRNVTVIIDGGMDSQGEEFESK